MPGARFPHILEEVEVHFTAETEKKLKDLAVRTGRATDDLVEDATVAYVDELLQAREMLNSRYEDLKTGRVKPVEGEEFFENLRHREDELLNKRSSECP